ncbi:MAG: thiamine diphosphokinase [Oscillospiraceae bacterium]|nr:thiamine diphosphokinase [Oscillospiraceae bacterium]
MKPCWIFCGAPSDKFNIFPPDNAYIIAADNGYSLLKRMNIQPDLLLGDFDSLHEDFPDNCKIIHLPAEKDDTDTMYAVRKALSDGYTDITIAASIGGRLDHTFANIQTLAYIINNGGQGKLLGEDDFVQLLNPGKYIFPKINNMYFSVFSYSQTSVITTLGTKYNLTNYTLTNNFPLGVSNEIIDDNCILNVYEGQILIIFSKM